MPSRIDNLSDIRPALLPAALAAFSLALAYPPGSAFAQAPMPRTNWVAQRPAPVTYYRPQPQAAPPARPVAVQAVAPAEGDPYGFTAWLNGVRARCGLRPVGYDPNLAGWAAANNAQQQMRGLGHFVMGPARRQNSAMGSAASIGAQWLNSPAHRAALLDPSVSWIGLAGSGAYWTLNLR